MYQYFKAVDETTLVEPFHTCEDKESTAIAHFDTNGEHDPANGVYKYHRLELTLSISLISKDLDGSGNLQIDPAKQAAVDDKAAKDAAFATAVDNYFNNGQIPTDPMLSRCVMNDNKSRMTAGCWTTLMAGDIYS